MSLDHAFALIFLTGFLSAVGLALVASAGYQHLQIVRYLRHHRPRTKTS